jgi:hypothetical protein
MSDPTGSTAQQQPKPTELAYAAAEDAPQTVAGVGVRLERTLERRHVLVAATRPLRRGGPAALALQS